MQNNPILHPEHPRHKQELAPGFFFRSLAPRGWGVSPAGPFRPFFFWPPGLPEWGGGWHPQPSLVWSPWVLKRRFTHSLIPRSNKEMNTAHIYDSLHTLLFVDQCKTIHFDSWRKIPKWHPTHPRATHSSFLDLDPVFLSSSWTIHAIMYYPLGRLNFSSHF